MRVVVAGSDTGVGKTFVTAALGIALSEAGHRVTAVKPVESGTDVVTRDQQDGVVIASATGQAEPLAAFTTLAKPVAPPVAADEEGRSLDWSAWVERIESLSTDILLVEGAGGLLSPLTWSKTSLDLAIELSAPVLLVASDQLGVLNSVLLSIATATSAGVEVLGVVFSAPEAPDDSTGTNAQALERFLAATPWQLGAAGVTSVPRCTSPNEAGAYLSEVAGLLGTMHEAGLNEPGQRI